MKTLKHAAIVFLSLILSGCASIKQSTESKAAAEQFLTHMQSGEFDKLTPLLSSKLRDAATINKIKTSWQGLEQSYGQVSGWSFVDMISSEGVVTNVRYKIRTPKGTTIIGISLVPEHAKMVVSGIKFFREVSI